MEIDALSILGAQKRGADAEMLRLCEMRQLARASVEKIGNDLPHPVTLFTSLTVRGVRALKVWAFRLQALAGGACLGLLEAGGARETPGFSTAPKNST